jgi:hypothetical protein
MAFLHPVRRRVNARRRSALALKEVWVPRTSSAGGINATRASGINVTFGASRFVIGVCLISAALLLSYGNERKCGSAQADLSRGGQEETCLSRKCHCARLAFILVRPQCWRIVSAESSPLLPGGKYHHDGFNRAGAQRSLLRRSSLPTRFSGPIAGFPPAEDVRLGTVHSFLTLRGYGLSCLERRADLFDGHDLLI